MQDGVSFGEGFMRFIKSMVFDMRLHDVFGSIQGAKMLWIGRCCGIVKEYRRNSEGMKKE